MSTSDDEMYDSSTYRDSEALLHSVSSFKDSGVLTRQEQLKICCRPTFRMRRLRNRGAILLLMWIYLITTPYFINQKKSIARGKYTLAFTIEVVAGGLTLSIAGWIADIYFGRYKVIRCSMWIMWIAYILATGSTVVTLFNWFEIYSNKIDGCINEISIVIVAIGLGAFVANMIQFGIDQLHDASSEEISAFIIWSVWTGYASGIVARFLEFIPKKYDIFDKFVICVHLSVALCLLAFCKHILIKEPVSRNPFKLVYLVIRYAIKNKYMRYRSAFTYCEDEIPSRIDFGKNKYGGPFTTEQVEDVKTFLRLLVIVAVVSLLFSEIITSYTLMLRLYKLLSLSVCTDDSLRECYFKRSFLVIVEYSWAIVLPLYEFIIYPIFYRFLSPIKTSMLLMTGVLLQVLLSVSLMLIEIMARHNSLDSGGNSTLQCVGLTLSNSMDYRWMALPCILYSFSVALWIVGIIRFIAAQSPYSMRGLVMGSLYGLFSLSAAVGIATSLPFTRNLSLWGTGVINCGFWHSLMILIIEGIAGVLFLLILKWYKRRKREDVLPNEHIFAERYYES